MVELTSKEALACWSVFVVEVVGEAAVAVVGLALLGDVVELDVAANDSAEVEAVVAVVAVVVEEVVTGVLSATPKTVRTAAEEMLPVSSGTLSVTVRVQVPAANSSRCLCIVR